MINQELPPRIQEWLNQIESGKAESDSAKIMHYMSRHKFATNADIMKAFGVKHQTATARMSTLCQLGILYECGIRKTGNKSHQLYGYVSNPDNYKWFGELYRHNKMIERLEGVRKQNFISEKYMSDTVAELARLRNRRDEIKQATLRLVR